MAKAKDDFRRAAGGSQPAKRRRSGSEKRKRGKPRSIRFTPEEDQRIAEMEKTTSLPFASLVRHALFNEAPPRGTRRPSVDDQKLAHALGRLGKVGGNVNQLARQANIGNYRADDINMAMRDLAELRTMFLEALGFERERAD